MRLTPTQLASAWVYLFVALLTLAGTVGCTQSEYPLVQLTGTVTFDGGPCPAAGSVTLQPLETSEKMPNRPAVGQFGTDGKFAVNSFNNSKGVVPGRYLIEVTCYAGAPDASKPDPWASVDYIAEEYEPAEITISSDKSKMSYDIDVPTRKRHKG